MGGKRNELILLSAAIAAYVLIRSWNFPLRFQFTQDPASFATIAMEIWRTHKPVLLGPPVSFRLGARYLFQGPATYYFIIPFLIMGRFDPMAASYFFMLFTALMVIPLYYGGKWLLGGNKAWFLVLIYGFMPYFVEHSLFFWNPNFQLSMIPLLLFFMGLGQKTGKKIWLLPVFTVGGILLQFHYQFALALLGLFVYYAFLKKAGWSGIAIGFAGLLIGFSPLIFFELRNHFYNTQTLLLFIKNYSRIFGNNKDGFLAPHYWLSNSLLLTAVLLSLVNNRVVKTGLLVSLACLMAAWCIYLYFPAPVHANGMKINWTYNDEIKVYEIIKRTGIANYNVTNLIYDNVAVTTKFFLKRDRANIAYDDYYNNDYLYAVSEGPEFRRYSAYEINNILPGKVVSFWKINQTYSLYLIKRQKQ